MPSVPHVHVETLRGTGALYVNGYSVSFRNRYVFVGELDGTFWFVPPARKHKTLDEALRYAVHSVLHGTNCEID